MKMWLLRKGLGHPILGNGHSNFEGLLSRRRGLVGCHAQCHRELCLVGLVLVYLHALSHLLIWYLQWYNLSPLKATYVPRNIDNLNNSHNNLPHVIPSSVYLIADSSGIRQERHSYGWRDVASDTAECRPRQISHSVVRLSHSHLRKPW